MKPSNSSISDYRILPGGRLEIIGMTLNLIIREAFRVRYYQIAGGPVWLNRQEFDIVAKAEGDPGKEEVLAMLRALLADRFALKVHSETKPGDVYALVVSKGAPKLKPPTGDRSWIAMVRLTPRDQKGVNYAAQGHKASMAQLADHLSDILKAPVSDKTGIQGEFDFRVEYSIDPNPETGLSIFGALQGQLGLKLVAGKGPVEILVIDRAEMPSSN